MKVPRSNRVGVTTRIAPSDMVLSPIKYRSIASRSLYRYKIITTMPSSVAAIRGMAECLTRQLLPNSSRTIGEYAEVNETASATPTRRSVSDGS